VSELHITAGDLTRLAGQLRDVATNIEAADRTTDGVTAKVAQTHGLVCALSAAALGAAQASRSAAAKAMQSTSNDLAGKLDSAAANYSLTDQQGQGNLNDQIPPR
jgi:Excreted virulence factor EspC, type VII ESX diderm